MKTWICLLALATVAMIETRTSPPDPAAPELTQTKKPCPKCKKLNAASAKVCAFCKASLTPGAASSGIPVAVRLTTHKAKDRNPAWGANGKILFCTSRNGGDEVWIMNADGSGQTQVVPGDGYGYLQPGWSPDGRIVYVRFLGDYDIFTMNGDFSNKKRITDFSYQEFKPSWGPNGKIAYVSDKSNWQDIFLMDEDGSNQISLTNNGRANDTQPSFGPDGRIAFCSDREDANGNDDEEIYVMNADGSGQMRLTNSKGRDYWPSWGPDGRIAFVSERNGNADIYVMNSDGSNVKRLTDDKMDDLDPSFGPNGMIAFYSRRGDGDGDIWVIKAPK